MPQKITIIDYGMGNIFSIQKRLNKLGVDVVVSSRREDVASADKLILPGVGHFGRAMENLKKNNLIEILNEAVLIQKKPILGICLGMQLLATSSEEGSVDGLNWISGTVEKLKLTEASRFKIPQIGWNTIKIEKLSKLMLGIKDQEEFYFVHSYKYVCENPENVLNTTNYEENFCSAIEHENIYGVQYHPEKSHDQGEQLFKNFISL
ncbi:MAG: imidazole glycerol phosphate synthase subunit HisH [Bacteroidetes bacterium]|nr:imidazole glycerol phosphate synthase subunit HisH [Bacteroidota bacterium]